jgi:hypothetical protein
MNGKHFCDEITSGSDIHGHNISIRRFCPGRERDMCNITSFRIVRVPPSSGVDCPLSNGVATPRSDGQWISLIDNCYKRVTKW